MADHQSASFPYLPHTPEERDEMLRVIGVSSFEELISQVPQSVRSGALDIAPGMSELELREFISSIAAKNKPASAQACFLGGGCYHRFIPAVVPAVVSRSEFATAYTPYQPEVSQGTLQAIYEFQTAICLLTGMDVANASMYDGPTACAEAVLMASRLTGRNHVVMPETINPEYAAVTRTYTRACNVSVRTTSYNGGRVDPSEIPADDLAAIVMQYPNYFGCLEDPGALADLAHSRGALLIVITEPISLGLLTPPGELGADIVVGDAQPCGNGLAFGGPSAGYMACRKDFVRQMPGRIAGLTVDNRGQRAFTLTLQTREQHIRRARATSNICTNQALNALAMLVYLTLMGPSGLRRLAEVSVQRAHHLADLFCQIPGVRLTFDQPFFNEFAIQLNRPAGPILDELKQQNILGGLDLAKFYPGLKGSILVAVTEMNSPSELLQYATALAKLLEAPSPASSRLPSFQATSK